MRILFTISYYIPYVSGLTIHAQRVAEMLAKQKQISVDVLTSQHDKHLPKNEVINGVRIRRVPFVFRLSKGHIMPSYVIAAFTAVKAVDTIVINLPQPEGLIPAIWGFLLRKKVLCIYHCDVTLPEGFVNRIITGLSRIMSIVTLCFVKEISTYTKEYAIYSNVLHLFQRKVTYIYPPIPTLDADRVYSDFLKKKVPTGTTVIGMSTRVAAEKGIEYLIQAIPYIEKKIGNITIVIAGPKNPVGEKSYTQKLQQLFVPYRKKIIFLGTLSPKQLGSFYRFIDILVLPSTNSTEAFGMVQIEAMLCGTPVVATNLPGVNVPIKKTGMGILVQPRNVNELVEAIVTVITKRKLFIKNKETIEKYFSLKRTIKLYQSFFSL